MKLFVVGSNSPNPEDWGPWTELELVVAETIIQAVRLSGYGVGYPAAEIDMAKAQVLMRSDPLIED